MRRAILLTAVVIAVLASVNGAFANHDRHGCTPASVQVHVCYRDRSTKWFPSGEPVRQEFLWVDNDAHTIDVYLYLDCTNRHTGKGEISGYYSVHAASRYVWGGVPAVGNNKLHCPMDP